MNGAVDVVVDIPDPLEVTDKLRSQLTRVVRGGRHDTHGAGAAASADAAPRHGDEIKVIGGGITNALFKFTPCGEAPVLVRVFGPGTELMIDRERESMVSSILARSFFGGKRVHSEFKNGRVEQWLLGRSLDPPEMLEPKLAAAIAKRMAELHGAIRPSVLNGATDLTPRERFALNVDCAAVWTTLDKWSLQARDVALNKLKDASTNAKDETFQRMRKLDIERRVKQLNVLRAYLNERMIIASSGKLSAASSFIVELVLCHNDVLSGNVLLLDNEDQNLNETRVELIDCEYAGYNPRAFDIANHFCECCGFNCDWSSFPDDEKRKAFLLAYVKRFRPETNNTMFLLESLEDLSQELLPWVLASHMFWGFWGVLQSVNSPIDFDFLGYACLRFEGLDKHIAGFELDSQLVNALAYL